ncbi:MAG: DUF1801 domain-containing protein [Thiohalomonadales bacterium]
MQIIVPGEFIEPEVNIVYNTYPKDIKDALLKIRHMIFEIASESEQIGDIIETLKWDNPSYLTHAPKSGTTIRLSSVRNDAEQYAISVHCQTNLISGFKIKYPKLQYDGNRSIILNLKINPPYEAINHFIYLALTYTLHK